MCAMAHACRAQRIISQRPATKFWNDEITIAQLRYTFYTEESEGSYVADASGVRGLAKRPRRLS